MLFLPRLLRFLESELLRENSAKSSMLGFRIRFKHIFVRVFGSHLQQTANMMFALARPCIRD